jgi:putative nucleotidyltransferase with HDIG domain
MRVDSTFLRSKVARRIFVLFISCALLPIAILAFLSFSHVTKQLNEQSKRRLYQTSKAISMSIYERLLYLEAEMKMVSSNVSTNLSSISFSPFEAFSEHLKQRFRDLIIITDTDMPMTIFGRPQNTPALSPAQKQHIQSGETLLFTTYRPDHSYSIFMGVVLDPKRPRRGILLAEINTPYLWYMGDEDSLPPMIELCILDQSNNVLFSSLPSPISFPKQAALTMTNSASGQFEWVHENKEYLASYGSIYLQGRFFTPKWTVVLSESKANMLAPMANFKKIFPFVILLSVWVVLLLSVSQIRRTLIPLEKLKEGTLRIARRDFNSRVTVKSGNEFEELAITFNTMASQLDRQFNALTTIAEIDRAILSTLDTGKIVDVVLSRMRDVFPCECISMTLLDSEANSTGKIYIKGNTSIDKKLVKSIELTPTEVKKLCDNSECVLLGVDGDPPHYLAPLAGRGFKSFLVLPILLKQKLSGIITLGYLEPPILSQEDLAQARQLTDQVAVALSNARLIEDLNQLNWGTLTALARAIDAKSPWTAGHSEQVTQLALKMGRALGLSTKEMEILQRGGLLHDIGKLGIPPEILDKPEKLTPQEERIMREHVRFGARILEPIAAYAEVIPIVLQHHERFDGMGYPDGLAGEAISLGARIFAVADCFDALTADRPYRRSLGRKRAIEMIKQESGHQFDPKIVKTFLMVIAQEERVGRTGDTDASIAYSQK